jgi:hypothetical protein
MLIGESLLEGADLPFNSNYTLQQYSKVGVWTDSYNNAYIILS